MPALSIINSLFRNLFHRQRVDRELDEELNSHLELLTEQKISEGMTAQEARRAARIELGGVEQGCGLRLSCKIFVLVCERYRRTQVSQRLWS
jgi:hypothetical protein